MIISYHRNRNYSSISLTSNPKRIGIFFSGAGNGRIAVRVLAKTRAKSFSLWRVNFSVPAPKRKNSRATFLDSMDDVFVVREGAAEKNCRANCCIIGFCFYLCNRKRAMGSYQSGQMGLTVTQLAYAFGGSNPSLPTRQFMMHRADYELIIAEVAQLIEH